jgi:hypothetical protein
VTGVQTCALPISLAREIVHVIHPTRWINMTTEQMDDTAICQWIVGVVEAIRAGKK